MDNKTLLLNMILDSTNHPTADDLYCSLRSAGHKISLATVYNNLNALVEEGSIRRFSFDEKSEHYDKPLRHDHLVCRCCGRVSDVTLQDFTTQLEESLGVTLEYYDLKLFYLCEKCRENKENWEGKNS